MNHLPLVVQLGQSSPAKNAFAFDAVTSEDPLPASLASTSEGYTIARATLVTDVRHETMDDK
jgi:hypothetical protein